MKKLLLLAVMAITLASCSDDDKKVQPTGCQMKVLQIGGGGTPARYDIQYGVSFDELVSITVTKEVYDFYKARTDAGNMCWIGEVTHE